MASNSESGHAKNVANFGTLVSFCTGYGAHYNPSNSGIAIDALTTMQTDSQNAINAVNSALPAYHNEMVLCCRL